MALKASVVLFPGQGSQYVGMASKLSPKAKSLFEMANQILGYDLLGLCRSGPAEELNKTIHSQPAMLVSSLAAVENLAEKSTGALEKCIATAGFSVGEYAALVFAQSIDFVDALRLIKIRAEATHKLGELTPSGMMTVLLTSNSSLGQACTLAREYCIRSGLDEESSVCSIANHLFSNGKVVGGHQIALDFIQANARDFGLRTKRLAVSAAFHTDLMRPAKVDLKNALAKIKIKPPKIAVYSNIDADIYKDENQIRRYLAQQVYKPVKWESTIRKIYLEAKSDDDKLPVTFECGPGNNLTTILGMINLKAKKVAYNIE